VGQKNEQQQKTRQRCCWAQRLREKKREPAALALAALLADLGSKNKTRWSNSIQHRAIMRLFFLPRCNYVTNHDMFHFPA
jgi:hypothetical protein